MDGGTLFVTNGSGPCPGDMNGDGRVDGRDLSVIAGQVGNPAAAGQKEDLDGDGSIGGGDIEMLKANFGCGQAAS